MFMINSLGKKNCNPIMNKKSFWLSKLKSSSVTFFSTSLGTKKQNFRHRLFMSFRELKQQHGFGIFFLSLSRPNFLASTYLILILI